MDILSCIYEGSSLPGPNINGHCVQNLRYLHDCVQVFCCTSWRIFMYFSVFSYLIKYCHFVKGTGISEMCPRYFSIFCVGVGAVNQVLAIVRWVWLQTHHIWMLVEQPLASCLNTLCGLECRRKRAHLNLNHYFLNLTWMKNSLVKAVTAAATFPSLQW